MINLDLAVGKPCRGRPNGMAALRRVYGAVPGTLAITGTNKCE